MKQRKQFISAVRGCCLLLAVSAVTVSAQGQVSSLTSAKPLAPDNRPAAPVVSEYLSGQAEVLVRGNQDPPIRLGLAQNGVTVVEFPVADQLFAVHPGASRVVTVDESPTMASDHYLVFRAGPDFVAPRPGAGRAAAPEATVSVQMQSGLFLTFLFYPVAEVTQMAHRCTVLYSRPEVVATRRAAGLAANLDTAEAGMPLPAIASQRLTQSYPSLPVSQTNASASPLITASAVVSASAAGDNNAAHADYSTAARQALQLAWANPGQFTRWSPARHGLTLAVTSPVMLDEQLSLAVVAVRNTGRKGLRLWPAQPELAVATVDERGQIQRSQPLPALYTSATAATGDLPGGTTAYYAVVYATPILDASQQLCWLAAHNQAADEPAMALVEKP